MNLFAKLAGLLVLAVMSMPPVAAATVTFEELGEISGVVPIGNIGGIDFGWLGAFDTSLPDVQHLSTSPTNAAYLSPRIAYAIKSTDGNVFDFVGASFARSYAEGDYFQLIGRRDGEVIYSRTLEQVFVPRNSTPSFFDFNWEGIDTLSISWTGFGQLCCSTGYAVMDNFTYQISSAVPEPSQMHLLLAGLLVLATFTSGRWQSATAPRRVVH